MEDKEVRLRVLEALTERASTADINNPQEFLDKVDKISQYVINGISGQPSSRRKRTPAPNKS